MPPRHEFSCQRHFLSPFRSANRWKEAAGGGRHGRGTTRHRPPFGPRRGGQARHGGRAADSRRSFAGPHHRTHRAASVPGGARRRPCTFTGDRFRRSGQDRIGCGFDPGAGSRSAGSCHTELVPTAAPRAGRTVAQNGVSARAGLGRGNVPARSRRQEQCPAARRDGAGSEKMRRNNRLHSNSGSAGRISGCRILLAITVVIRSNMSISLAHVRPGAPPAGHGLGLPAPSKPLIYNGFWKFRGESPTVPAPGPARRRRRLLLAITVSGFRTDRARGASDSPETAPCRCLILPDPGCHASLAARGHSRCCRRASWAAPLRRASSRSP